LGVLHAIARTGHVCRRWHHPRSVSTNWTRRRSLRARRGAELPEPDAALSHRARRGAELPELETAPSHRARRGAELPELETAPSHPSCANTSSAVTCGCSAISLRAVRTSFGRFSPTAATS